MGDRILDVTSQDSHQALVKASEERAFVDALSPDIASEKVQYAEAWRTYHALVAQRDACKTRVDALKRDEDYITYQLQQLEGLSLDPGEEERLIERKHALKSLSTWQALSAEAEALFEPSRSPFLSALGRLRERLRALSDESGVLAEEAACFAQGAVALEEGYRGLSRYLRTLDFGERDLDDIEKKLSTLKHLQRKYGMGLDALAAQKEKWQADMTWLSVADAMLKGLEAKIQAAKAALIAAGEVLSNLRAHHAEALERGARTYLPALGMPKVEFDVCIQRLPASECEAWPQEGADEVVFLFSANPGQPAKPLGKIASGGELSRVLLAIKASGKGSDAAGSLYLFDEIDAGVGGKTADLVGQVIRSVSVHSQVLCITHLAQVAQYADAHFVIEKEENEKETRSVIRRLSEKERTDEIARMLGGDTLSSKTKDLARDILKRGKSRDTGVGGSHVFSTG
jgi:DNA repair protein RecN (Recombination protein N)